VKTKIIGNNILHSLLQIENVTKKKMFGKYFTLAPQLWILISIVRTKEKILEYEFNTRSNRNDHKEKRF